MKFKYVLLLAVIAFIVGCAAEEADAGDPVKDVRSPRLLTVKKPGCTKCVRAYQAVQEQVQVEVKRKKLVPVEKTVTVYEQHEVTCVENRCVTRQVPVTLQVAAEPRQTVYRKAPIRTHLKNCKIGSRIKERLSQVAKPCNTAGFGLER